MSDLPTGTVTFLFTDIEGSTRLWEEQPDTMRLALARHDALLRAAIETSGGCVFKTIGDAFCAAFAAATDALDAALAGQQHLQTARSSALSPKVPLRVRMALHTGEAELRDGDYFGPVLNRVARLLAIGYGAQVLLSEVTQGLVREELPPGTALKDLGSHRLRDLQRPERVYQLLHADLPADFPALRSLTALPNNLPQQVTSFIGRRKEMGEVRALLERTRLLTLTGAGGTGKTRLSLQVAADLLEQYPDGVWLVELAPLTDPELVIPTAATTLGLKEEPGQTLAETLVEHLKAKQLLLILDNCEHLLLPCARLADLLLRRCPHVKLLASSREGLNIPGETTYRLASLTLPDLKRLPPTEELAEYEAVRLFADRAEAALPSFAITSRNAPAVAQLCFRLDGIPLALELAAARLRALSVEQIAERVDDRFRLLTGGSRTALPRQQTLRALIDWSYELLSEPERTLLQRLSVFAGGWTLDAAETVCADCGLRIGDCGLKPIRNPQSAIRNQDVLDLLTALVDRSLVLHQEQPGETRYRLLETIRQYARDRLLESGSTRAVRAQHAGYFVRLAAGADVEARGAGRMAELEAEHDNLRAALEWSLAEDDGRVGLQLTSSLSLFWRRRGYVAEGRAWFEQALAVRAAADPALRQRALFGAAMLARGQGDFEAARAFGEEQLGLCRTLGDRQGIARSLAILGSALLRLGDSGAARACWEECLLLRREAGDRHEIALALQGLGEVASYQQDYDTAARLYGECLELMRAEGFQRGIGNALLDLGHIARWRGDYAAARTCYTEAHVLLQQADHRMLQAHCLHNLAHLERFDGDHGRARALYRAALAVFQDRGDRSSVAFVLMGLGCLAAAEGKAADAARLFGAVERLREAIHAPLPPPERPDSERHLRSAREALDEGAYSAAWAEGREMTLERAVALALEEPGDVGASREAEEVTSASEPPPAPPSAPASGRPGSPSPPPR